MAVLDGIKVLEVSQVMQAPLAAQILGDFGADVVKVERPGTGEIMRYLDRHGPEQGRMSCYFAAVNRNKRFVCLDLKRPEGREAMARIARQVDVLIHNYRPGVMERLGFSYDELSAHNPRLIYAVAYAFGESGPMSQMGGQDMVAQAVSGLAMNGVEPGGRPRLIETPTVDYGAGATLAQGILAALFERERSGLGQKVTISLLDTALTMQVLEVSSRSMYDYETNWLHHAFVFRTRDGWLTALALFRENPLRLLCAAFDMEDLSRRPEFATVELQLQKKEEIYQAMDPAFGTRSTAECLERLMATDILCAPILTLEQALAHPQTVHNQTLVSVPLPEQGTARLAGNPLRLSRTPPEVGRGPAKLGQDTRSVLHDFQFSKEEIAALEQAGALGESC